MNDDVTLIQPLRSSITVSRHPHTDGDAISVAVVAGNTGTRHLILLDTATAEHLADLLATAVRSPRVNALADERRGAGGTK